MGSPNGQTMIDLTNLDGSQSMKQTDMLADTPAAWIKNSLYVLNEKHHQLIASPTGWLNDTIIQASQLLIAQHFPDIEGLQPPILELIQGFRVHSGEFLQLLNVRRSHWILVSNVGCDKGVVHVYDTMYSSIPLSTVHTITRLVLCQSSKLTLKMVGVDLQRNSSDCGVLCLTIAFDILCSRAPQVAKYTHKLIRKHLCECLEKCCFSPSPAENRGVTRVHYKYVFDVDCVCRLPEHVGREEWAECEGCLRWFHQNCLDIPENVFDERQESW